MRIDPHVHCRDGRESYKETIAHVLRLCDQQGVTIIFDMPNTDPPLLTARDAELRLKLVPEGGRSRYRVYLGATADVAQLRKAVSAVANSENIIGLKLYAGCSVGSLAVVAEEDQLLVYRTLADAGYTGVLAVHCEKESLCVNAFDPKQPSTHSLARPPAAEIQAIADQIRFAEAAGFQGALHICHVSTAAGLDVINSARGKLKITCGVTPHHLLWSAVQAKGAEGLLYKINPPLRDPVDVIALRKALKDGDVDWIETDHAPHPISEKLYPPYASGYPSLCLYRTLVEELLPCWGLSGDRIRDVTDKAIRRVFDERKLHYDT
ncbi:MAG: dihydroorotase [Verrucomicrobia bacterium]|nr:dihydroorotase [Verrucomicrobiota bacterium]MBU4290728.1 dihydroorotase [Verrucomicrobiota bacterium]MBU4429082.1 dihydroorotase [Verrucomicrobiota bacterium]MCG2680007.1 dihydroorotase [Kiritimatiellia bacterium]